MKEITTEIIVNAPIKIIWDTLLDFKSYPNWNPFIQKIEGDAIVGDKLVVTIKPEGQKAMRFRPIVLNLSNYHLSWLGSFGVKGIFDGEHHFNLIRESDNKVRFMHSERFSGILCKPFFAMINKSTIGGFNQMNQALKKRCEDIV